MKRINDNIISQYKDIPQHHWHGKLLNKKYIAPAIAKLMGANLYKEAAALGGGIYTVST